MRMLKHEDVEALEQQIRPWLEKMGITQQSYMNLLSYDKNLLHDVICGRIRPSARQRRDLYRKLCSPETIAGRDSMDPVDSMTDDDLTDFFRPLTPSQAELPVDWGC